MSVRLSQAGIVSKQLDENSWFWYGSFLPPRGKSGPVPRPRTRRYGVPADAISVPADSAAAVVKFTISIPRESCINAKAKYGSSVVPPDPSVHFYHCFHLFHTVLEGNLGISKH